MAQEVEKQYNDIALRYGLNPDNIITPIQAPVGGKVGGKVVQKSGENLIEVSTDIMNSVNRRLAIGQEVMNSVGVVPKIEGGARLPEVVKQVESGGNPNAVSPKGAVGTMQTMPSTLTDPGFGVSPAKDNTPQELERVGKDYLGAMKTRYGNDAHALVAYNWGPANADRWIQEGADFSALPTETQNYLIKIAGLLQNADR
jgi:hypothetical protein